MLSYFARKNTEAVVRRCFVKKMFLKISQVIGKPSYQSLFLNKVAGFQPTTLLKNGFLDSCFPVNLANFIKNTYFEEYFWTAASENTVNFTSNTPFL